MKKNLLNKLWLRVGMIVAIMTTAFAGTARAEEVTFDFPTIAEAESWENGTAYTSYTITPITVEALGGGNNGKYYTSSNGSWRMYSGGTVRISAAEGYVVTSVASNPSCTFTVADGVATFSPTARTDFKTITVTYTSAGGNPTVATPVISGTENFLTSTEVTIACGTEDATILYTTDGTTWETYSAPFTLTETTTVQAKGTKSGMDDSSVATKTFTKSTPYTVAEARAAIDAGEGTQGVYATGIVSAIPTAYSAEYKNITFNFVDAEGDTDFLQAYRCAGAQADEVQVGDVVVVYGNLTKYNTTYEFAQGCELISLTHPAVAIEAPTFSPEAGVFFEALRVTISSEVAGAEIYYTTDGTEPTAESTLYTGAIEVITTTTIKAIAVKGSDVSPVATAVYAILAHAGTEADPYTVADARAAIDANDGLTDVYATGIVSEIPTAWSTEYNNITFNFVDATGDADFLQAYRCVSTDAADASAVAVGDIVVVKGTLKKYNTTYEFGQGCELVSLTHSGTPAEPVIVAENATIAADVTYYELMYSIENPVDGTELTATTDASWITSVTPSTKSFDRVMIECEANEGEERTATITLTYGTVTKDVTLTQEAYVAPVEEDYVTLPYSWAGGTKEDLLAETGVTANGLGSNYAEGNAPYRVKFDTTGDYIQFKTNERPGVVTVEVKMIGGANPSSITVQESEDGETFTEVQELAISGAQNDVLTLSTTTEFAEASRYIRLSFTKGSNVGVGPISIAKYDDVVPETYTLSIANPKYVTITASYGGETILQNGENARVTEGTEVTLALSIDEGYELESLTVEGEDGQTVTPTTGTEEGVYFFNMPAYNVTVNATAVEQETPPTPGTEQWVEVALDELTADDVFVIVGNNGNNYAMSNNKGTTSAPAAAAVTVEGNKLTSAVADSIKWTVSTTDDGYVFYPYGETEKWLYCTNTNNGVRVGEGDANIFTLEATSGYLVNSGTSRYIGIYDSKDWRCYTSINNNIKDQTFKFYKKVGEEPSVQTLVVSEAGYATMVAEKNLEIPTDVLVEVFAVKVNGDYATLLPITAGIPAGEPVLVKADAGEYNFTYTTSEVPDVAINELVAATEEVTADGSQFVLANGEDGVGFYKAIAGTAIAAGKAYLVVRTEGEGVKNFISFEDDPTSINEELGIRNEESDNFIYNLAGQRLQKMQRGVNIVGGKKVMIK